MAHDIVVIGASAGGVEALKTVISAFPNGLPAAVFVVLHVGRTRSFLPEILSRHSQLPVIHANDGAPVVPGRVVVAPPDAHLVLEDDQMRLTHEAAENGVRPAIDPLFRSAARVFGERVIGVILTGALDDGVAGLAHIKRAGGVVIVQDPTDAAMPGMPQAALDAVTADFVAPLVDIPEIIRGLTADGLITTDRAIKRRDKAPISVRNFTLTCPACNGSLWEVDDSGVLQFRCHVGHQYSIEAMLSEQAEALDRALWAGLRALQERAGLQDRVAAGAASRGQVHLANQFKARALRTRKHAEVLRKIVTEASAAASAPDENVREGENVTPEPDRY